MSLKEIQQKLKVPKGRFNEFGKFNYRSCSDILELVKPLLGECVLALKNELVFIEGRFYAKVTAVISDDQCVSEAVGYAREPEAKKGMDECQVTGSAFSYAAKYALSALFLIDDEQDSDTRTPEIPDPTKKQQDAIDAVCDKLLDSVPEGRVLVDNRVGPMIYSLWGRYPEDDKTAGPTAAAMISQGAMDMITKCEA